MALGIEGFFNTGNLFNFGGTWSLILDFLRIGFIIAIIGGALYLYFKKKNPNTNIYYIRWWEERQNDMIYGSLDKAEEITIPGTNLKIFFVKAKRLWLPRFTRLIADKLFYVATTPDREIVNFTLQGLTADRKKAGLFFDHTDMKFAAENLREFVKKNYHDKAIKWWQLYKNEISTVIHILIHTLSIGVFMYFLIKFTGQLGGIAGSINEAAQKLNTCRAASGILGG